MSAPFASSVFAKKPDEKALVQDVYKKLDNQVLNSYTDATQTSSDMATQFGFMSKTASGNLLESLSGAAPDTGTSGIGDMFSSGFGKAKTLVSDFASGNKSFLDTIKSTTNSVTGALRGASTIYSTVNGIQRVIKNGNMSNLRSVSNMLNAVTGRAGSLLSPQGPLTGVMTAVVGQAGAAGISDSFKMVADTINTSTDFANKGQAIYQVATGNLPAAISRGDLNQIASMVDYVGKGSVGMMNPKVIKLISKTNDATYPASEIGGQNGQFYQYSGAYQKIDPNWNKSSYKTKGSDTTYTDLSCLNEASVGTRDVFITGSKLSSNDDDKMYGFITGFGNNNSVKGEIQRTLPGSPAATTTNIYNKDVDPRLYDTQLW